MNALELTSGAELERFTCGTVVVGQRSYNMLTGHCDEYVCSWCGGDLKGRQRRYCCTEHREEYYRHFDWASASSWAMRRADDRCENCHRRGRDLPVIGHYMTRNLQVHHIVPLKGESRQFTAFNLPWNLIVLCQECHVKVHAAMRSVPQPIWEQAAARGQGVMHSLFI